MEKTKNKTYTLRFAAVNKQTWQYIKEGKKKIETRAATIKYQHIKMGDTVVLSCTGKKFQKNVKRVTHFKSIDALLKKYKPEDINPDLKTKEDTIARYWSFPRYKEKIEEFGLLAFELE